jgi:hypothetical protein
VISTRCQGSSAAEAALLRFNPPLLSIIRPFVSFPNFRLTKFHIAVGAGPTALLYPRMFLKKSGVCGLRFIVSSQIRR